MTLVRFARKVLLMIASGTTTVILAACYGMSSAVDGEDYSIGVAIVAHDSGDNPIEGLEVTMSCATPEYEATEPTGANGEAVFYLPEETDLETCTATITDTDGAENGGAFASQTVQLNATDAEYAVEMSEQ
jgi:hypothetical protein